jgi:phosphoribosylaminoimidazole-succinocarboxamide synthase
VKHVYSGKVRDLYELPDGRLLFVASDRISAYDWILPTLIPDKGRILTQLSLWWFEQVADLVPTHVMSASDADVAAVVPQECETEFAGRSMICERLKMVPIECVARGYLTGSGLADYELSGSVCGVPLPSGLTDGDRLPGPIFTPATKAALGDHDENVSFAEVERVVGRDDADVLRALTLAVYSRGEGIARDRGIILADTKLEFGRSAAGRLVLADEVLTPDSSRFWPAEHWKPGRAQPSYDKQYVRNWLTSPESGWDRRSSEPPPPLPEPVVEQTRAKYVEAYERLTGSRFV